MTTIKQPQELSSGQKATLGVGLLIVLAIVFGMFSGGVFRTDGTPTWAAKKTAIDRLSIENRDWVATVASNDLYWRRVSEPLTFEQKELVYLGALQLVCGDIKGGQSAFGASVSTGLMYIWPGADSDMMQVRQVNVALAQEKFC